ncbi:histone-arginine methyltransferase METTL23-like isoform X2 [Corticium candelabrum]|uniref:histone-arginine methyltransferase METTL23-like isoform X2 n=1 Tax=Corticium candelabrum TaxID=121492 RepID=UPI002E36446D|nr:histone-arginine methyltransferase METTL23-like isoform X2 [Corticium candelabrum]
MSSCKTFRFGFGCDSLVITTPELGAGTALPGIVAAKCRARVILSDQDDPPETLGNCQKSCEMNGVSNQVQVVGITWGIISPYLLNLPPVDFILASDCFYDSKDFEDIFATVVFLMERNRSTQFWMTYQERSSSRSIVYLLDRWGMQCEQIPLTIFGAEGDVFESQIQQTSCDIRMFIFRLKD